MTQSLLIRPLFEIAWVLLLHLSLMMSTWHFSLTGLMPWFSVLEAFKMQQSNYSLAVILHEGHRLYLAKLIIAQFYEEIRSIVTKSQNNESIILRGPMWFLQL